ncbi:hypothetical protein O0I10_005094 [Lichtheimia ornata]|uniref:Aspartate/glutamate/uridylate kinase domain-containing protein n=1 Tax=Lichtheimia ornata TaxID=688661 RepID=A0AAD7V5V1_9FUNG|nr:uncharacterized protein O0I10_005094 [Lichtheimia ornata]KAJ8659056.1 hypothetical protein O0I10_005094 [Lichtheimia ornata]
MKTVIIKLGGAAITNKKGSCQLAEESALDALMLQIQHAYESLTASGYQVILIHGAGSFGHPQARQYNLKEGWNSGLSTPPLTAADAQVAAVDGGDDDEKVPTSTRKHQKAGFAHTRKCLLQLHLQLLGRLQQRGLPVLSLSPFDHVETDNGDRSSTMCFESLAQRADQLLKLGFIPLLHGDAVLDRTLGCTILSGDVVMHKLVMLLPNVTRCVFVTDVEGIFDMDPKAALNQRDHRRPKLFKHMLIDPIAMNNVTSGGGGEPLHKHGSTAKTLAARKQRRRQAHPTMVEAGNGVVDVTGGMGGKNKWARQIILDAATQLDRKDVEIVICKSGSPEATRAMALDPVLKDGAPLPEQRMTVFSLANA